MDYIKPAFIALFSFITLACTRQNDCANEEHIFNVSPETQAWIPDEALVPQIKFRSETGQVITFQKEEVLHKELDFMFLIPCNGGKQLTTVFYERIAHIYSSGDSMTISMATNIDNIDCYDSVVDEVKLYEEAFSYIRKNSQDSLKSIIFGVISIQTKLINVNAPEEVCHQFAAKSNAEIDINGTVYRDVYSDDRIGRENSEFPLTDIYFQKGKGIIGYVDEYGIQWERVE